MYKLDSGLISLIATIAAIVIGVYSSMNDKKKARARKQLLEQEQEPVGEDVPEVKMFNNPFEELLKAFKEEAQPAATPGREERFYVAEAEEDDLFSFASKKPEPEVKTHYQSIPLEFIQEKERMEMQFQAAANEGVYDNGLDSIENTGVSLLDGLVVESGENAFDQPEDKSEVPGDLLKERIKRSPRDLVLFTEVLRPKYQEF